MRTSLWLVATALVAFCVSSAGAAPKVETVVDGLDNPCGIAIQPGTGTVFVADSGANRVVRITGGKAEDVIVGFPTDVYGKGPKYNIGPLGLAFVDQNTLVVGGGGFTDDNEMLRVYKVPAAGAKAIKADAMAASFKLPASEELKPEGNFYGVVVSKTGVYVTCNGDDTKGWVGKADIKDGKVSNFRRFIATKEATEVDAPVAVAINDRGHVVIGQMGEITVPNDSLLTFYHAKSGKKLLNVETGLFDITGLAYSPKGLLFATDFAWMATEEGGLFRLDKAGKGKKQSVKAHKVVGLDKPTAMAFGKDGTLYITVIGTGKDGAKSGKLVKIAPGL